MTQGDVYIYKFHPSFGDELRKHRPVVVLSDKISKIDSRFVCVVPLSSSFKYKTQYDVVVSSQEYSFLEKDSYVIPWYMHTIAKTALIDKVGSIKPKDVKRIHAKLVNIFK